MAVKWPQDAGHSWTVNISAKTEEVTLVSLVGRHGSVGSARQWRTELCRPSSTAQLRLSSLATLQSAHQATNIASQIRGHNQQY